MGFLGALLYALLMNGVPFAVVIATGGSPAILLLLYWFETVALVITGAIRIVLHRRATAKAGHYASMQATSDYKKGSADTRGELADENTYLRSFLGITVVFTIAHGLFVGVLVFLLRVAGPVTWDAARAALVYTIFVQGLFLLWDMSRLRGWTFAQLARNVGAVPSRVLVTQLGLIFGLPMIGIAGPWGLVGTFVAFRALGDASFAWLQGFVQRRDLSPGFARFLARRAKQTPEALEAEFDAMKARGLEVEALLELPIEAARRAPAGSGAH